VSDEILSFLQSYMNKSRLRRCLLIGQVHTRILGATPQGAYALGGFKAQERDDRSAVGILDEAKTLKAAGAFAILFEAIPAELAQRMSEALSIWTVVIGAGQHCDAQVLDWQDMLGLTAGWVPKFVNRCANLGVYARDAQRRISGKRHDSGRVSGPQNA
jgi:3-methyl-2-oxobutanoate hydroxymethyltransferase